MAAPLAHRHDRPAVRRPARRVVADRRGRRRDPRDGEPGPRRRPDAGRRRRHVRRAPAAGRAAGATLDGPGVARAPGRREADGLVPDQRRQVHDLSGHGPRRRRRRARRTDDPRTRRPPHRDRGPAARSARRRDPTLDALRPRSRPGSRRMASNGVTPTASSPGTGREATEVVALGERLGLLARSRRTSTTSRPRSPGPPATSSPSASTTSSPGGPGWPRSCRTGAPRSRRGSPPWSVRARLEPGSRTAEVAATSGRAPRFRRPAGRRRWHSRVERRMTIECGTAPACPRTIDRQPERPSVTGRFVLALDQGTTSSRAIAFDRDGQAGRRSPSTSSRSSSRRPATSPTTRRRSGASQLAVAREALATRASAAPSDRRDRHHQPARDDGRLGARDRAARRRRRSSGRAGSPPRSATSSGRAGHEPLVRRADRPAARRLLQRPEDPPHPRSEPGLRARAERGELAFGTVDSFLLWRLTGGRVHATDVSNA